MDISLKSLWTHHRQQLQEQVEKSVGGRQGVKKEGKQKAQNVISVLKDRGVPFSPRSGL